MAEENISSKPEQINPTKVSILNDIEEDTPEKDSEEDSKENKGAKTVSFI